MCRGGAGWGFPQTLSIGHHVVLDLHVLASCHTFAYLIFLPQVQIGDLLEDVHTYMAIDHHQYIV